MSDTTTLYFAVEVPDLEDFDSLAEQAYAADSPLIRQLEMVIQTRFGGVMVNPVRDGVILKIADAQMALRALALLVEILDTAASGVLHDPPPKELVMQAHHAVASCLEVIANGGA